MTETPVDTESMSRAELTSALHSHLEATAHLPLDSGTNRWLGEAQAVAADLATNELAAEVVATRAATVVELLEAAGEIDHEEASDHVTAGLNIARELTGRG